MVIHKTICGKTGSGKSEAELVYLIKRAMKNDCAIIVEDPHGELVKDLLLHLQERHLLHRVIYDRIADTDRCPAYDFLVPSTATDPLQRLAENEATINRWNALLIRRGDQKTTAGSPMIEEGLKNAGRLFMFQKERVPLTWLAELYTPGSPVLPYMLQNCTHEDTRRQFEKLAKYNPNTRDYHVGPAERRLRGILTLPTFQARCGEPSVNFDQEMRDHAIILLDGEDADPDAISVGFSAVTLMAYHFCRRDRKTPVLVVLEEALNAGIFGIQESHMLAEIRKFQMAARILVQSMPQDPFLRSNMTQNTRRIYFGQESPEDTKFAASDIAKHILDPLRIHHIEERIRNVDDGFDVIENTSQSKSKDKQGKTISVSETHGHSIVKKSREKVDKIERYMSLSDQETLVEQRLRQMRVGERWHVGDAEPFYEPMEPHLWHHLSGVLSGRSGGISAGAIAKLKAAKLEKAIAQVKSKSLYRKPVLIPPPSSTPSPPPPARRRSGIR